ncbi:hypothetical protein ATI61_106165 [Archangium gephyra]|uniref:Uncharacterized protein n=1 Tax=Archangium gephyra TaxID=48 RepID=A0AAC8Q0Z9_9BACT|nr:hypothetical protein [Archangium gephyra]AKI98776.1 Hypothetical protein AA314_00403 [Archangium gephyra]REG30696.1 hypothetical protein ATI61_106165 [Archangium gephyra]
MDHRVWSVREEPGGEWAFLAGQEACGTARTVERAFGRCGFSDEEWGVLQEAPLRAFVWVATADGPVGPRQLLACRSVLEAGVYSRSPLVGRICGESLRQLGAWGPEWLWEVPDLEPLRPLVARVAERLGLGEAARFHGCLLEVGRRVARASNGWAGRVLGRVRGEERLALETLVETLGSVEPWRPSSGM